MSAWLARIRVPILLLVALAGCHAAPPARAPENAATEIVTAPAAGPWEGSGGASSLKHPGDALASFALSLQGTRYRYGGATPEGFDCSGLVFYAHRRFGLAVPRTSRDQEEEAESVKPRKLRRGDLVFFKIGSRTVNHVGIYIGKHRFVHAPGAGKPVTINSLDDAYYAESFFSAGRYWDQLPH